MNANNNALDGSQRAKKQGGIVELSIVNPNTQEIRLVDLQTPTRQHETGSIGAGNGSPKDARTSENADREAARKELGNGTVNHRLHGLAYSQTIDHAMDREGVGPIQNTHTKFLDDTARPGHQIAAAKVPDLNGTMISASRATVNPSLGSVYELQFKAIQESISEKDQNKQILEATTKGQMGQELIP